MVDIEFVAFNNPVKKMYNEVHPCIFETKTDIPTNFRSVYDLSANMRMRKKENILKFLVTEKTHATLRLMKRFLMYVYHIQFLTHRAGWEVTKSHYTFEQECFKKDFVLGNQRARQEAVVRGDNVQGNFYKLMNNSNFGFDFRNNLQNRSIQFIYDVQKEIEFITQYGSSDDNNCFLKEENLIKKCNKNRMRSEAIWYRMKVAQMIYSLLNCGV